MQNEDVIERIGEEVSECFGKYTLSGSEFNLHLPVPLTNFVDQKIISCHTHNQAHSNQFYSVFSAAFATSIPSLGKSASTELSYATISLTKKGLGFLVFLLT